VLALTALVLCLGVTVPAARADDATSLPALPDATQLATDRATFRNLAEQGLAQTQKLWWNEQQGWYSSQLDRPLPLASAWTIFPFFELTAVVAITDPTSDNQGVANTVAGKIERYWDSGVGGFCWFYNAKDCGNVYFDDTGWLGIAYLDAYRATKKPRWLWDAARALGAIDRKGWDSKKGGTWWDSLHGHKTAEPLAAGAMIAATLYRIQHKKHFLDVATRFISWADANTRQPDQGNLYGRSATDGTVMDYIQGMMIAADAELCVATDDQSWCKKGEALAAASVQKFRLIDPWAPEPDVVYMHGLERLYEVDHDPRWYTVLYANAKLAAASARDASTGIWAWRWDGGGNGYYGALYTQAATLELFGWLAVMSPPG
jgi:hypothetical protein